MPDRIATYYVGHDNADQGRHPMGGLGPVGGRCEADDGTGPWLSPPRGRRPRESPCSGCLVLQECKAFAANHLWVNVEIAQWRAPWGRPMSPPWATAEQVARAIARQYEAAHQWQGEDHRARLRARRLQEAAV